jgi:HEPN domain-containing protein
METGDAAEWLLHAESDLTYARLGQLQPAVLRNQVAFHAEQAAEKAFKSVEAIRPALEYNPSTKYILLSVAVSCSFSGSLWRVWPF